MAAIVIRHNAKATWLTGVRASARDMVQRAMAYVATAVMICAVGAALLNSLRRHLCTRARHRSRLGHPDSLQR